MITTVTGDISSKDVKYVLPHEHAQSDLRPLVSPIDDEDFYKELSLASFGKVTRNPYAVLDNALLPDIETQTREIALYGQAGGNLFVDVTTADFGRNPAALKEISEKSGVGIVAGCGFYIDGAVSDEVRAMSKEQMQKRIIADLNVGMDDTDIRAGVIGEVGSSDTVTEFEYKSLAAAAAAQAETGCGMHIHASLWNREGLRALDYAVSQGASAEKICIDHADVLLDAEYIEGILSRGAIMEFDDFGKEFYVDRYNRNLLRGSFATDKERVIFIKGLIDRGYVKQLFISNDICLKSMTHTYGGWGYDHVITNIIPMMEDFGIKKADIDMIMTENPKRFLERK